MQAVDEEQARVEFSRLSAGRAKLLIAGMALLVLAVATLDNRLRFPDSPPTGTELNQLFNLQLANPQNAFFGVLWMLAGVVLIAVSLPVAQKVSGAFVEADPLRWPWKRFRRGQLLSLLAAGGLFALLIAQMQAAEPNFWPVLVWLVILGLLLQLAYDLDDTRHITLGLRLARRDVLVLIGLVGAGLLIGSYQLDLIPGSIVGDEGDFFTRILGILSEQEVQSFFGAGVYTYPLPSSFAQAGIASLFGPSLWSWRFASLVPAVLAVIPLYIFARASFGRAVALAAGIVLITLPYLLAYGRMGYNNSQAILAGVLTIYFLYVTARRRSVFYASIAGLTAGLGFYTYTAGRLSIVIAALFIGALLLGALFTALFSRTASQRTLAWRRSGVIFVTGLVIGGVALAVALPHMVFTQQTEPDLLNHKTFEALFPNVFYAEAMLPAEDLFRDHPAVQIGDQTLFFRPDLYAQLLMRGLLRTLLSFSMGELNGDLYTVGPLAGAVGSIFFLAGVAVSLRRIRQLPYALLLLWTATAMVTLSIVNTFPARPQHMVPIIPAIALYIGLGIVTFSHTIGSLTAHLRHAQGEGLPVSGRMAAVATGLICVALVAVNGVRTYFIDMPAQFPRNVEQVMGFDALALQQPARLIYLTSADLGEDWMPWLVRYMETPAEFRLVPLSTPASFPAGGEALPVTVYVTDRDKAAAETFMACLAPGIAPVQRERLEGDEPLWVYSLSPADIVKDPAECVVEIWV